MENKLIDHLEEIQETATKKITPIISNLKAKSDLTEDMKNTNSLYWVGRMNVQLKHNPKKLYIMKLFTNNNFRKLTKSIQK